jgi:hypothetical protein
LGTAKSLKVQEAAVCAGAFVAKTRRRRRGEILKNTFTFMVHLAERDSHRSSCTIGSKLLLPREGERKLRKVPKHFSDPHVAREFSELASYS